MYRFNYRSLASLLIACVFALTAGAIVWAEEKAGGAEEGFTSLFNGKDLSGWVYGANNATKAGKGYQVDADNKVLYCTVSDGGNLYTEKEYANFIYRFDFKLTENANNGIGIRAPMQGDAAYVGM